MNYRSSVTLTHNDRNLCQLSTNDLSAVIIFVKRKMQNAYFGTVLGKNLMQNVCF